MIRFRRMIGLFAFFYGSLHFLTYVIADRFAGLDFPDGIVAWSTVRNLVASVGEDIYKRPFITIGFTAFICMVPLALTSTAGMIRRLGGRRWQALHRLMYVTGVAAVVHYWWLVKADVTDPRFYAVIVGVLLGVRVYFATVSRQRPTARVARAPESFVVASCSSEFAISFYRDPAFDRGRDLAARRCTSPARRPSALPNSASTRIF